LRPNKSNTLLVAAVVVLTLGLGMGSALGAVTFTDVPTNHPFYAEITQLGDLDIVEGFPDGAYRPDGNVTRQQFAKIILLAKGIHTEAVDNQSTPTFSDVTPDMGLPYPFDYVEEAAGAGFIQGNGGMFNPYNNITRAQLALILVRAGGTDLDDPPAGYNTGFTDLPDFAKNEITKAKYNGLLDGKTATAFDPYANATRGHVAKMVSRLLDKDEGSIIRGSVVDVKGTGIPGAVVGVEGQSATATTAADGSFELAGATPGPVYLSVSAPSAAYLDGETLQSVFTQAGATVSGVKITLSGRPSANATTVGMEACKTCHGTAWPEMFEALDGSPDAAVHSRFVTEGTDHLVYKDMWPEPGGTLLPRDTKGKLLMVQDPLDGEGLVNVVLTTRDVGGDRQYLFKFYPEQEGDVTLTEAELDGSDMPAGAVWIPVAATIGGEGNWGEGYVDPGHTIADTHPNFGEGKQRYMCRIQDVPFLKTWMEENDVPLARAKQDYVAYMPAYVVQDGTAVGSEELAPGDVGTPKLWQKSPSHWCTPDNTMSRNCAGCHATGAKIEYKDFLENPDPTHQYKAVVTSFDYKDLDITCERCHGPGSEHASTGDKTKIISPQYLSAKAGNELCGQCHASHAGKSIRPQGVFKNPFDANYKDTLGNGFFVPGVYDLSTFYFNYNLPTLTDNWKDGPFHSWPDKTHSRAHSQELPELLRSGHGDNPYEKLTCYTCHDAHSLAGGPASLVVDTYDFSSPAYGNNTLCLACHATHGPFEAVSKNDVAALQVSAGGQVEKDGANLAFDSTAIDAAKNLVASTVATHMQETAGMSGAVYAPANPDMPVGSCASCHMAKIAKLQDVNDDAQYHLAFDENGKSAVAEGNVSSHVFDIVWPTQSSILVNPDPTKGHDYDVMPNSCSKCHAFARFSGDGD